VGCPKDRLKDVEEWSQAPVPRKTKDYHNSYMCPFPSPFSLPFSLLTSQLSDALASLSVRELEEAEASFLLMTLASWDMLQLP
jgi:hypothetical protein